MFYANSNLVCKLSRQVVFVVIIISSLLSPIVLYGQDSKVLEKRRKTIQNEINVINKTLEKTLKEKRSSLKSLNLIMLQIKTREKLINTINEELHILQDDIKKKTSQSDSLKNQLKLMRQSYATTIQKAQYSKNILNRLAFIFSSKDFNQAYKRIRYFGQIASYRRIQANQIKNKRVELDNNLAQIARKLRTKNYLLQSKTKEKKNLDSTWKQQDRVIKQLKSQESKLRSQLSKKQKEQSSLNKAIQLAIKREIEAAKRKKAMEAKKDAIKSSSSTKSLLESTPEALKLSAKFLENKGKLPWPVSFGYIIEQFGTHQHPSLKKVKTNNIGVNIKTLSGSNIMCVFNGSVIAVQMLYGRYAVIVQHGEYFTTYANLDSVLVKRGDKLRTKQIIGKAPIDKEGLSEVQFIVTQGTTNVNPELWLASK